MIANLPRKAALPITAKELEVVIMRVSRASETLKALSVAASCANTPDGAVEASLDLVSEYLDQSVEELDELRERQVRVGKDEEAQS